MKKHVFPFVLVAFAVVLAVVLIVVQAAVIFTSTPGPWTLQQGNHRLSQYTTYAGCEAGAVALAQNATYTCRTATTIATTVLADTPPPPPPPPPTHGGLPIDEASFMTPYAGVNDDRLINTAEVAPLSDSGAFRTVCLPTHMSYDDPIVYPGQPGVAHGHVFFGNAAVDGNSTADSIANSGGSSCRGGTVNRTGYWTPIVVDNGRAITPTALLVYYKTGYLIAPSQYPLMIPPPAGLRMIIGNRGATTPQGNYYKCNGEGTPFTSFAGVAGVCPVGNSIWASITFPQCWDGVHLDSPDHISHMASPVQNQSPPFNWTCPASHPMILPEISEIVILPVPPAGAANWRLASDTYDVSQPGGYSFHADWFMGWKPDIAAAWMNGCVKASRDCHAHLLGDGRQLAEFDGN